MKGQGTEITGAVAAPVGKDGKTDLIQSGNPSRRVIIRMPGTGIGQRVDIVHLLLGKRLCRRILHHIDGPVGLRQNAGVKGIRISILYIETSRVIVPAGGEQMGSVFPQAPVRPVRNPDLRRRRVGQLLIGRKQLIIAQMRQVLRFIAGSRDKCNIMHIQP